MNLTTNTTRTIDIEGMTGPACVQKVTGALKDAHGVTTQSVKVGSATIGATQEGADAACGCINKAGFKAHEKHEAQSMTGSTKPADGQSASKTADDSDSTPNNIGMKPTSTGDSWKPGTPEPKAAVKSGETAHPAAAKS